MDMKKIEEKLQETSKEVAKEYVSGTFETGFYRTDYTRQRYFTEGANWMMRELTHWHDPKEVLPEYYKVVEIKHRSSGIIRISTAWMSVGDDGGYLWTIDGTNVLVNVKNVIGWRPIHE